MSLTCKRVEAFKRPSFSNVPAFQRVDARASASLFAKNNSRFRQIVWRELHGNLIARYNPNKMLPHFAGDMGKHVALTREIDAEHRARQDLSDSAFGDDLFFFPHPAANICRNTCLSRSRRSH